MNQACHRPQRMHEDLPQCDATVCCQASHLPSIHSAHGTGLRFECCESETVVSTARNCKHAKRELCPHTDHRTQEPAGVDGKSLISRTILVVIRGNRLPSTQLTAYDIGLIAGPFVGGGRLCRSLDWQPFSSVPGPFLSKTAITLLRGVLY